MISNGTLEDVFSRMHKILFPGEYGLGTELGSDPDDDKKAFENLGELCEELGRISQQLKEVIG